MAAISDSVSLIPYLNMQGNRFYISLAEQPNNIAHSPTSAPFSLISESGPFSKVFSAVLKSDAGQPAARLFLLTQKDVYARSEEASTHLNNSSIEQCWQDLLSSYSRVETGAKPLMLHGQKGPDETLRPFQPLFYCALKNSYFPPLCPCCGQTLGLCRDESILEAHGLQPYSHSLRRYLYCASCLQSGASVAFYAPETEENDPPSLIDRDGLIHKMGQIKADSPQGHNPVPCPGCSQRQACYGAQSLALSRISIFSFYPFYMFIFNADTIVSEDYAKLVSGDVFGPFPEARPAAAEISIASVLKRILHRWQSESSQTAAPDQALAATRMVSPPDLQADAQQPKTGKTLAKTHILQSAAGESGKGKPGERTQTPPAGGLEKTRIVVPAAASPSDLTAGRQPSAEQSGEAPEAAQQDSRQENAASEQASEIPSKPVAELEKTVIVPSGKAGAGKNSKDRK